MSTYLVIEQLADGAIGGKYVTEDLREAGIIQMALLVGTDTESVRSVIDTYSPGWYENLKTNIATSHRDRIRNTDGDKIYIFELFD